MKQVKEYSSATGILRRVWKFFDLGQADDKTKNNDENAVVKGLKHARTEWMDALSEFEHAKEKEIIDYCVYRIKACQIRYEYFLREAKKLGIVSRVTEEIHFVTGGAGRNYSLQKTT